MTRIGRRLIEDFLLPALNDGRYGDLLKWVDRDNSYFSIRWSHKNAAKWTLADTAVFQDWDKLKGHYHPEIKGYYMQAKQRFRAALYKLSSVRKLHCDDKHVKKYQLVLSSDGRRRSDYLATTKPKRVLPKKEESQKSIPTPVIQKNTSYIAKLPTILPRPVDIVPPNIFTERPVSPPSPASTMKSEPSDRLEELRKCMQDYQMAQKKQMIFSNTAKPYRKMVLKEALMSGNLAIPAPKVPCDPLVVLRENHVAVRAPHVPVSPSPVYSRVRQVVDGSSKRFESPHVLLVKTYHDEENNVDIKEDPEDEEYVEEYVIGGAPEVLNLSVKSEDSDVLSR